MLMAPKDLIDIEIRSEPYRTRSNLNSGPTLPLSEYPWNETVDWYCSPNRRSVFRKDARPDKLHPKSIVRF